ncbi:S1C family serine protease [Actinopolymorpha pittospori]
MTETTPSSGQPHRSDGSAPAVHDPAASRPVGQPVSSGGGSGGGEETRPLPPPYPYAYGQPPHGQPPFPPYGQRPGGDWPGGNPGGNFGGGSGGTSENWSGGGDRPNDRGPRRRGAAAIAAVALAAGLIGGGAGTAATYYLTRDEGGFSSTALDQPIKPQNASNAPAGSVQQVANKVLPSVVSITIATSQGVGNGSGIVLSDDGLILTNNHVAAAGSQGGSLSVTFSDGKTVKASVVGTDPTTDLAVIRAARTSGLNPAQLGSSAGLSVGQNVVAIGSPLGLSGTVTSGIVSALDRPVRTSGESESDQSTVIDAIQTDAAINPGNSGGALVNMAGQVVGINSAIATLGSSMGGQSGSIGVGFAIPIDEARPIAKQLIDDGRAEHAQLGVTVTEATGSDGVSTGAALQGVNANGAADKAGLRQGDVITKVDDRQVTDADGLIAAVRSYRPGAKVTLTYVRDGQTHTAKATLGTDGGKVQQPQQQPQQQGPGQDDNQQFPGPDDEQQNPNQLPFPWPR